MRIRYIFSSRRTRRALAETTNRHKKSFPSLARKVIEISDLILEVLDARYIEKTRNLEMERFVKENDKLLVYIINKTDLADISKIKKDYDMKTLEPYVFFSARNKLGHNKLRNMIKILIKKHKLKDKHANAHVGVIGYPNTGKSTIINILSGKKAAGTAPKSGFTKGIQKVKFSKNILILDTPGVFQEKENIVKSQDLKKQAEIGVRTFDSVKEPEFIVHKLMESNSKEIEKFYNIKAEGDSELLLDKLGREKGFLKKGNEVNADKTARYILKDWQAGKITKNSIQKL